MLRAGLMRALLCSSSSSSSVAAQQANVQWQSLAALPHALMGAATRCNLPAAATPPPHEAIQHQQRGICSWQQPLGAWQSPQHHHHHHHHQLHTSAAAAVAPLAAQHVVQLNRLRPAPGSSSLRKRWGRGDGGDRGTYCGRGVKGQKARKGGKPHLLFDGGQNQMKKFPKVWLTPSSPVLYKELGLSRVLRWVKLGLLDPSEIITMKDLRDSGCAPKTIRWGIELVATGNERPEVPLHLQVSSVSPKALQLVQAAGGSVERVYYTRLGLKALLKPENLEKQGRMLPRPVRAWPPRENGKFDSVGQLPPVKSISGAGAVASA